MNDDFLLGVPVLWAAFLNIPFPLYACQPLSSHCIKEAHGVKRTPWNRA